MKCNLNKIVIIYLPVTGSHNRRKPQVGTGGRPLPQDQGDPDPAVLYSWTRVKTILRMFVANG